MDEPEQARISRTITPRVAVSAAPQFDLLEGLIQELGGAVLRYAYRAEAEDCLPLEPWLNSLIEGEFDDVVFTTAQGVNLLFEIARSLDREHRFLKALGVARKISASTKANRALHAFGLNADVAAPKGSPTHVADLVRELEFEGRTVGIQPFRQPDELELARQLEGKGARVFRVAPATRADPIAEEVLESFRRANLSAIVLGSESHTCWLFDALRVAGKERQLVELLSKLTVVASPPAAEFLQQRGVVVDHTLDFSRFSHPQAVDFAGPLGLAPSLDQERGEAPAPSSSRRSLVVIGNGMVGFKLCELLWLTEAARRHRVMVFGEEPHAAYDRTHMSEYLRGRSFESLTLGGSGWYDERGMDLFSNERVVSIDRLANTVTSSTGRVVHYDTLVLATGAKPRVPALAGLDKTGVFVYRTLEDLRAIVQYSRGRQRALVLGGGLLGLEAAVELSSLGLLTAVVECESRLMPQQLDDPASKLLQQRLSSLRITSHLNTRASAVLGEDRVRGVRLAGGQRLDADLVIIATGITPRDELAHAARLAVAKTGGIVVNDRMQTNDPHIYAVGECVSHRGTVYGLTTPGYQMASVVVANLTGADTRFTGANRSTRTRLGDIEVASLGEPFSDGETLRSIIYEDRIKGVYKKLVLTRDGRRLLGGILLGDASRYPMLSDLVNNEQDLSVEPEHLLFGSSPVTELSSLAETG